MKVNKVIGGLLLIILILGAILIFRKPEVVVEPFDDTALRNRIRQEQDKAAFWEGESERWRLVADSALVINDSLENIKPTVKHHYHEIYKFNNTASNSQLDSVIRSNW